MTLMTRYRWLILWLAGALLASQPVSAQFYDLDGAYRCLVSPDPNCEKNLADRPPAPPAPALPPPLPKSDENSFADIVQHVRDKTANARDIEFLTRYAQANEPRAVEVLAWCRLAGIGGPRDPVAAYWLYRQAATLGVANARNNQIAIFEQQLTQDQRQQVLTEENKH